MRRPLRTLLTALGLMLVVFLVLLVCGFLRGLDAALQQSGDEQVAMIHNIAAADNLENSSISDQVPTLLRAELASVILQQSGVAAMSPELVIATSLDHGQEGGGDALALLRGVRPEVFLVRRRAYIVAGRFPKQGELLVGRLAATKMGRAPEELEIGKSVTIERKTWTISGHFAAPGTLLEAELWCPLDDLKLQMNRPNDLSLVALRRDPRGARQQQRDDLTYFCGFRHRDLELMASAEVDYYGSLSKHFRPMQALAWLMVVLISSAGACGAINTMYAAVAGRVREFGALQAIGFGRTAIAMSLVQESILLAALATLAATGLAIASLQGAAVRFSMGAFSMQIDQQVLLFGCGAGVGLGLIGAVPPGYRAFRLGIAEALKAV
jgi:ABC-type antimicrobial peptide transport system permease subunit